MAVSIDSSVTADANTQASNTAQSNLEPFLQADFDPAAYLNNALPSLSVSTSSRPTQGRSVPLPELTSQLQALLSQLNAQTSRLSHNLAQLTDEIVRSGGRLAYEVDVLRGETIGLNDSLQGALRADVGLFTSKSDQVEPLEGGEQAPTAEVKKGGELDYLDRLKTLASVRARLDAVVKVFGDAMEWPLAPSELSLASSIVSVAAPDSGEDGKGREEKGKAYAEQKRREIADMIGAGEDPAADLEAAIVTVQEMKRLAEVWKGTSEEKARLKFVDSLQKVIDDKQRSMARPGGSRPSSTLPSRPVDYRYGDLNAARPSSRGNDTGFAFLQNLRNLKSDT